MFSYIYNYFFPNHIEETTFKFNDDKFTTKIEFKPTSIPNSKRSGCFATEDIPKGSYLRYHGSHVEEDPNNEATWWIVEYDETTGELIDCDNVIGYIDGMTEDHWTRHINYSSDEELTNITVAQYFNKIYYYAYKDIKAGDEIVMPCEKEYFEKINA